MLGFTAVATSTDIDISKDDIDDCQWFSREQLATFYAGTHSPHKTENSDVKHEYRIGSGDSISSYLITAWKNKEIGEY